MSHQNSNVYRTNNEQIFLINILNTMYNDNLVQINNLQESNSQIRNLLVQILTNGTAQRLFVGNNSPSSQQHSPQHQRNRGNSISERRPRENGITSEEYRNPRLYQQQAGRRLSVNTQPQFFDFIGEYNVPLATLPLNMRRGSSSDPQTVDIGQLIQSFLQPIEVRPTPAQIETATRRVQYCDIVSPQNTSCPISMEEFGDNDVVTVIRHCSHIFNTEQITNWFTSNCRCPVCRYDIREYNSNVSSEFYQSQPTVDVSFNAGLERSEEQGTEEIQPPRQTNSLYESLRSDIIHLYNNRNYREDSRPAQNFSGNNNPLDAYVNRLLNIDISGNNPSNTETVNLVVSNILNMINR